MNKITLNRADIVKILETLDKFEIDYFTLIKGDSSGIGYTLDIEFPYRIKEELVEAKVSVVGTEEW